MTLGLTVAAEESDGVRMAIDVVALLVLGLAFVWTNLSCCAGTFDVMGTRLLPV